MTVQGPFTASGEELDGLLIALKGVESVELKLTVPDAQRRRTVAALGLDPLDAQIRQVFFFDTPDLLLNQGGLVVRARRVQRGEGDTVVKLRPVVPSELPRSVRRSPSLGVELDAMPDRFVTSASLKGKASNDDVRGTASGGPPLRKLFTKEQRGFFAEHAPEGIGLDDLAVLGPIFVLKLKSLQKELGRPLVTEMWLYPDGSRVLELSTKCRSDEAFQVAAESRAFLNGRGIEVSGDQQTKTGTALAFFSAELLGQPT